MARADYAVRFAPTWRTHLWLQLALAANRLHLDDMTAWCAVRAFRCGRTEVVDG